ncbi:MAG TPA: helix-turn-helix domain-containing protein [Gemmatimonadaceae bacterium]|nr:helix-turn-helix domain-containing protein [Gemmatimonadaceae bacterium]
MTADELRAARERLSLSVDDLAAELGLTPHVVEAMERGKVRVPRDVGQLLAWRVASAEGDAVLAASGLPPCPVADAILAGAADKGPKAILAASKECVAHAASCPTCQARADHLARYAPPLPEFPLPWWVRAVGFLQHLPDRLPRPLRPPPGDASEGRRVAVVAAAGLSAFAAFVFTLFAVGQLSRGRFDASGLAEQLGALVVIVAGYFVGFYMAGWVVDLTRPIRHRFVGYVLRGALCALAIYGTIGVAMPIIDGSFDYKDVPPVTAIMSVIGAVAGAVLWVKDRVSGKLPARTT